MALSATVAPLTISLTQGGNDAFVQGSVSTGLTGRQAYNLKAIHWNVTSAIPGGDAEQYQISVTRRSKAAAPNYSDADVIWLEWWIHQVTTSGATRFPQSGSFFPQIEIPLVEDTLYAQLDSAATSAVQTCVIRLDVELDTISDIDRLNLITRSLA